MKLIGADQNYPGNWIVEWTNSMGATYRDSFPPSSFETSRAPVLGMLDRWTWFKA